MTAGARILVAVSGGPDSSALLVALSQLARSGGLKLAAAHLHHGLRGDEADQDLEAVRAHCRDLEIPLDFARWDTRARMRRRGLSGQAGLRILRREFLLAAAKRVGAAFVATGHTADDQLETLLLRLARGTGLDGLAGISPQAGCFVRPMLGVTRAEVVRFLAASGTAYRCDRSNQDVRYARNRVRARVVPELARLVPGGGSEALPRAAFRAAREIRLAARYLAARGRKALGRTAHLMGSLVRLDCENLRTYAGAPRRAALRAAWARLGEGPGLTLRHMESLERLIEAPSTGSKLALPGGQRALRRGRYLWLGRVKEAEERPSSLPRSVVTVPGRQSWAGHRLEARWVSGARAQRRCAGLGPSEALFGVEGLRGPLVLRGGRPDENFIPFGRQRTVRLGAFLKKQAVGAAQRARLPVLADRGGVLWIPGVRRSARALVTGETSRALHVRWGERA